MDKTIGPYRVGARIGAARVHEDLFVLLVPRIERGPVESDVAVETLERVRTEEPGGARPIDVADPQAVPAGGAAAQVLRVIFIDDIAAIDVRVRDVVFREGRVFPHGH